MPNERDGHFGIPNIDLHFEPLNKTDNLPDIVRQEKLRLRDEAIKIFPDNPLAGFALGKAYKNLIYSLAENWYNSRIPQAYNIIVGLAASGSISRGESSFYSDIDFLLHPVPTALSFFLSENLKNTFRNLGYSPDVKTIPFDPYLPSEFEAITSPLIFDPVFKEFVNSSDFIIGNMASYNSLKHLIEKQFDIPANSARNKALYSIFEMKNPRNTSSVPTDDIFNLKFDNGGLGDFLILRTIAKVYNSTKQTSPELLIELANRGYISSDEAGKLTEILSEYLLYRNDMHIFAGGSADLLGPKTRRYISKNIGWMSNPDVLKKRLTIHREFVRNTTVQVIRRFLRESGINPDIYENFSELPQDDQMQYANSPFALQRQLAAWCTTDNNVLNTAVKGGIHDYSTFQAAARSKYIDFETAAYIEKETRNVNYLSFVRLMLAVNPLTPTEVLVNLALYSDTQNKHGNKALSIALRRLTHLQYEDKIPLNIKPIVDSLIFYPNDFFQPDNFIKRAQNTEKITERLPYLNFAGRLIGWKNFEAYLKILSIIHKKGIKFEAHIFGPLEPGFASELQLLWLHLPSDSAFYDKLKFHGNYNLHQLKESIFKMRRVGKPLFLFSKDKVSKELLSINQPILTTHQGNTDIDFQGLTDFREDHLNDPEYLAEIANLIIRNFREDRPEHIKITENAAEIVRSEFNLSNWCRKINRVIEELNPSGNRLILLGKGNLNAPQGVASWFRNLIKFHRNTHSWQSEYIKTTAGIDPIIFSEDINAVQNRSSYENEDEVFYNLENLIKSILNVPENDIPSPDAQDQFLLSLIALSQNPNSIPILSGSKANEIAKKVFLESGINNGQILYQVVACDELNAYGKPVNPMLKITRLVQLLQTELTPADVILFREAAQSIIGIKEKILHQIPLIHVDHVLASDRSLIKNIESNRLYSKEEKEWFRVIFELLRRSCYRYLDKYIAVWPENQQIVTREFGVPIEKTVYIPNGIDMNY